MMMIIITIIIITINHVRHPNPICWPLAWGLWAAVGVGLVVLEFKKKCVSALGCAVLFTLV